jgi:hypothetical protein
MQRRAQFLYNGHNQSLAVGGGAGVFTVSESAVRLAVAGLAGAQKLPILYRVEGPITKTQNQDFYWTPYTEGGAAVELAAANTVEILMVPGTYKVDFSSLPAVNTVVVSMHDTDRDHNHQRMVFVHGSGLGGGAPVATHAQASIGSPDGTITTGASGTDNQTLSVAINPAATGAALAANAGAVAALAAALAPSLNAHVPATAASADGTIDIIASGANNQTFDLGVNPTAVATEIAATPAAITTLVTALAPGLNAHDPATITNADGVIDVTQAGQAFTLDFDPEAAATEIAATPAAITTLVTALTPGLNAHVPATVASSDGSVTVVASGTDSQTFNLTVNASGVAASLISSDVGNDIVLGSDSKLYLSETVTALSYAPATKVISYTDEAGNVTALDLSALAVDIYVNGATFDAGTGVLTLTDVDGTTPDVVVNLAALKATWTDNADGTFTYSQAGSTYTLDFNANALPYDNAVSGLVASDVQAAIDELGAALNTPPAAVAPVTSDDPSIPTTLTGTARTLLLADPDGWMTIGGKKVAYWN